MNKSLGIIQLSFGDWYEGVDENLFTQSDKDLLLENSPVVTFYNEDGTPNNYTKNNDLVKWDTLAEKYANQDHLCCKLAITYLYSQAVGATEQERFDTFTELEKYILIKYNCLSDDSIGVAHVLNEEGFDATSAQSYYLSVKFKSMEYVSLSCLLRYNNKADGWYPILFSYYSQSEALLIKENAEKYKNLYVEDGVIGTLWGSSGLGLLDFFHGSGEIPVKLEDNILLPGKTFEEARDKLTEYFYKRWEQAI